MFFACEDDGTKPNDTPENPTAVSLVFPYNNSLCIEGIDVTDSESTVLFEWEPGKNTDEYELNVENLISGSAIAYQTPNTQYSVILNRATPYAWFVLSKSNSVADTAKSEIWKFYNSGEAIQFYAPFPAEIISPAMAVTISAPAGVVSLDWKGSDVDDDITGYDVYFGTATPPGIAEADHLETILVDVAVSSGTIYFWRIITKDLRGNTSDSGIYQFKVQ